MKPPSAGRTALRRAVRKFAYVCNHLLYERTVLVLAVMLCLAMAGVLWHLSRLSGRIAESMALESTSVYSDTVNEARALYTLDVVERLRPRGIQATHDYASASDRIPLPATFAIELSDRIGRKSDMRARLYSDHPFPW